MKKFAAYAFLVSAVQGLRPLLTTTTTTRAPENSESRYPADAHWTVESDGSSCNALACSGFYTDKRIAELCQSKLGCGNVRYLRAFSFFFCKAAEYFVIPVDRTAGNDDSFWDGSDPFLYLPVVNGDSASNFAVPETTQLTLYESAGSSGGTSCNLASDAAQATPPKDSHPFDCEVTTANSSMIRINLTPFMEGSYMGIDRNTIVIKKSKGGELPAPMVGPFEGLVGVFHSEPSAAFATLAASLLVVVTTAILMM